MGIHERGLRPWPGMARVWTAVPASPNLGPLASEGTASAGAF